MSAAGTPILLPLGKLTSTPFVGEGHIYRRRRFANLTPSQPRHLASSELVRNASIGGGFDPVHFAMHRLVSQVIIALHKRIWNFSHEEQVASC